MGRSRVLVAARLLAAAAIASAVMICSSCGYPSRLYEESIIEAESGLAGALDFHLDQASDLIKQISSADQITVADLERAFGTSLIDYQGSFPPPVGGSSAVYDMMAGGSNITFSLFLTTTVDRSAPGVNIGLTRFGCTEIAGLIGSSRVSARDTPCPEIFEGWGVENSEEVSLETIAELHDIGIGARGITRSVNIYSDASTGELLTQN